MKNKRHFWIALILMPALPVLGILAAGKPISQYIEFPPTTRYVVHEGFSWPVFVLFAVIDLALFSWLILSIVKLIKNPETKVKTDSHSRSKQTYKKAFPWWGWVGVVMVASGWIIAWNRFSWASFLQKQTFIILWVGYILVVNGLSIIRTSTCPLYKEKQRFWLLFPFSAAFWWFFEYLNRFVQNWYYKGVEDFSPLAYFVFASASFSIVLPAVYSTHYLLLSFFEGQTKETPFYFPDRINPYLAWALFALSAISLLLIGIFPNILFPLLWVSPFLILISLGSIMRPGRFSRSYLLLSKAEILSAALAAFICGIFWEMWNFYSLSKWEYAISYVDVFPVFEMPLLGYGGYLPFGLECLVISKMILAQNH